MYGGCRGCGNGSIILILFDKKAFIITTMERNLLEISVCSAFFFFFFFFFFFWGGNCLVRIYPSWRHKQEECAFILCPFSSCAWVFSTVVLIHDQIFIIRFCWMKTIARLSLVEIRTPGIASSLTQKIEENVWIPCDLLLVQRTSSEIFGFFLRIYWWSLMRKSPQFYQKKNQKPHVSFNRLLSFLCELIHFLVNVIRPYKEKSTISLRKA